MQKKLELPHTDTRNTKEAGIPAHQHQEYKRSSNSRTPAPGIQKKVEFPHTSTRNTKEAQGS
jgi:hypothetical protein